MTKVGVKTIGRSFANLRVRLVVALLAVFALGAAAMGLFITSQSRDADELLESTSLPVQAQMLAATLRPGSEGRITAVTPPPAWRTAYATPGGAFYTLYDAAGHVTAQSANLTAPLPALPLAPGEVVSPLRLVGSSQTLALAARAPGGQVLMIGRGNPGQLAEADPDLMERAVPALIFAAAAASALLTAWVVAAWSLRPLARVSREARRLGPEAPMARLDAEGVPAEARPLIEAVNRALDRVAEASETRERFTADAAHALRTPVSVLDLRLQHAERTGAADWAAVRADTAELARVIAGLLALSRAERPGIVHRGEPVNFTRLVREAAAAIAPALEAENRSIELMAPAAPLTLAGDAGELRDLVTALLDNARRHGRGQVVASLTTDSGKTQGSAAVILTVIDQGPGVPAGSREAVFERFARLNSAASGAGLGLAVVRRAARNHGGDARITDEGFEVRLGVPCPAATTGPASAPSVEADAGTRHPVFARSGAAWPRPA